MYKNILVPVDLDDPTASTSALETAAALARCFSARITICSVVRNYEALAHGDWLPISYERLLFEARTKLDAVAARLDDKLAIDAEVGTGTICGGILDVATRTSADLIILASHRPGTADYVRLANAARVARRAPCSVLIVRADPLGQEVPQHQDLTEEAGAK